MVQAEQNPQEQAEYDFLLAEPCSCCQRTNSRLSRRALRACLLPLLLSFLLSFRKGRREWLLLSSCCVGLTSLLRCVSLFVKAEMVSGPTAKD